MANILETIQTCLYSTPSLGLGLENRNSKGQHGLILEVFTWRRRSIASASSAGFVKVFVLGSSPKDSEEDNFSKF